MTCLLYGPSTEQSSTWERAPWWPLNLIFTNHDTSLWIKAQHSIHFSSWMGCSHSHAGTFLFRKWAILAQSKKQTHIPRKHVQHYSQAILVEKSNKPGVSATPPGFMPWVNLRIHSVASSRSPKKFFPSQGEKTLQFFKLSPDFHILLMSSQLWHKIKIKC